MYQKLLHWNDWRCVGTISWTLLRLVAPCILLLLMLHFTDSAVAQVIPRLVSKTLYVPSPVPNAAVWVKTFYSQAEGPTGQNMMSIRSLESGDDNYKGWKQRFSNNNGATWSEWEPMPTYPTTLTGWGPGWVDPSNGRLLMMHATANTSWSQDAVLRYGVSLDGGHSYVVNQQIDVGLGPNVSFGANVGAHLRTPDGKLLFAVAVMQNGSPVGDAAVLIGEWQENMSISWRLSNRVLADINKSTIGFHEPTITQMPDGRILMVMRGSNGGNPNMPGYKWYSVSTNGGQDWSLPQAWKYSDGSNFFSPSSCSQLIRHSNGNYYWIGNISPENTNQNTPRYPLVIGQIDPVTLGLIKTTVTTIDSRGPGDDWTLELSNFYAYEDRISHEIVADVTRYHTDPITGCRVGDCYTYRIAVPEPSSMIILGTALATASGYLWRRKKRASIPKQRVATCVKRV